MLKRVILFAFFLLAAGAGQAQERAFVDNFRLLDHQGRSHELYYHQDAAAIVLMIHGNGCPIVRAAWPGFAQIRDAYADRTVRFFLLNANLQDDRAAIAEEAERYGIDVPILDDETQLIAESLGVTRTAEVLVIDPESWEIAYRGPINDRVGYERQRKAAQAHYLKDALDAVLAGKPVAEPVRVNKGCIVNLPGAQNRARHARISYSDTIAPLLRDNCAMCHREGGIGPWAMTDYRMIKGFAPMIREVVRTKRMPPWHADPAIGAFHEDRSLSVEETQTLIHWIEAGAPRGDGPDPLAEMDTAWSDWPLGQPDLIVDLPAFEVPATGVIDYQFPTVKNPLDRDVWVRAVTLLPGDREVVHHALVGTSETVTPPDEVNEDVFSNYLIGYVPGAESYIYPEDTGVLVKAGGEYVFQMHYTPSGKATVDRSKLGVYFHKDKPKHYLRQLVAWDFWIDIPAGARNHEEHAYFEFHRPTVLYYLFPHAHYRGKASRFDLRYPDGRSVPLLSVPNYDFNWQHTYKLKEPLDIPAGAKLIHRTVYDNSAANFANPDPDRAVPWGLQSEDEMLYGSFMFRWADETTDQLNHNKLRADLGQAWGFIDEDMDGRVVRAEMRGRMAQNWDRGDLKSADQDGDQGLSVAEYYAYVVERQRRARAQRESQSGGED